MSRVKGILAAGALTGIVLVTIVGLGLRSIISNQQNVKERPISPQTVQQSDDDYDDYEDYDDDHDDDDHDEYDDDDHDDDDHDDDD